MKTKNKNNRDQLLLKIDLIIQLIIVVLSFGVLTFQLDGIYFFIGIYFVLGGWQIFSFLFHLKRRLKKLNSIRSYALITAWSFVLGLPCLIMLLDIDRDFIVGYLFFYLALMLFAGPILAVAYFIITNIDYKELK